jgi:aspartyl-tRNA(Asn)/glutamyl-tRNA(Gln) amidotransferase subunit C
MSDGLTLDEVDRIAALAHLALTADEREQFTQQLADILAYARQVQDVDVSGVAPTSHTLLPDTALRDDEVRPSLPREQALSAAPEAAREAGFFRVPRVIGG